MNPSNDNKAAGTPVSAAGKVPVIPLPPADSTPKTAASPPNPGETGQVPQAAMTTVPLPLPAAGSPASPQANAAVNQTVGFQVADDKDVIEPEWVHKAKSIVRSTIDDPYKQSEDLTVLKADYMQKRYNKIVKLK
jgi:hypothetical protein